MDNRLCAKALCQVSPCPVLGLTVAAQVRTTSPVAWCTSPDRTAVAEAARRALTLSQGFRQGSQPLATALVRGRLFFPDRRLVQFDCGKLQV